MTTTVLKSMLETILTNRYIAADFVAKSLSMARPTFREESDRELEVGTAEGKKRSAVLYVSYERRKMFLLVGDARIPLEDVIQGRGEQFTLNVAKVHQLIDGGLRKSKTQDRHDAIFNRYQELMAANPEFHDTDCVRRIVKTELAEREGGKPLSPRGIARIISEEKKKLREKLSN